MDGVKKHSLDQHSFGDHFEVATVMLFWFPENSNKAIPGQVNIYRGDL